MSAVCKRSLPRELAACVVMLAFSANAFGVLKDVDDTRGSKCNVDPTLNQVDVILATKTPEQFSAALATDPAYRALVGNVTYLGTSVPTFPGTLALAFPPLDDPVLVIECLQASGEFTEIDQVGYACFAAPPPSFLGTAVEYYNTALDHYFFTPDAKEQTAIDAGAVGATWIRTGKTFPVIIGPGCRIASEDGLHYVYRFAGEPNIGPNSHFFTVSQDECAVVRDRTEWHWIFEGVSFWASEPVDGTCPTGMQTLYRAYNNGKGGEPNHRYATDHAVIDTMVAQGWVEEGVAICVPPGP
jgi:hypothetical protein